MKYINLAQIKAFLIIWKWYAIATAAIVLVAGGVFWSFLDSDAVVTNEETKSVVKVGRVIDLLNGGSSLSVVAEIRSVSEATISTESGGRVVRVSASLGDFVPAGKVLAEVENSSQRAALLQAEGSLDAAKAAAGGSRGSALTSVLTAYAAVDDALNDAVGQIHTDPELSQSSFRVSTRDTEALAEMESLRPTMQPILKRHESQAAVLSDSSDLTGELTILENELREVRNYLDITLKVLNAGVVRADVTSATISGYVADVSAARTAVTTSLSAVISARTSLDPHGTVSASAASVKQAQGAYNAALANLEKTIIRSPISGSLNNFTIKLGDILVPAQQVAVVSNNGALEAVAYVTEEDKARVVVGQKVTFEGGLVGTITKIAPALDPVTRRIEVRIGLPADARKAFTNGQTIRVALGNGPIKPVNGPISIPITALKIEASRTIVFLVENEHLAAKEIKIGKLSGASVQVTEGLDADTEIVVDARGLKEGDEVTVNNQ